jgi:cell wall-associated NlpC family hydrolase
MASKPPAPAAAKRQQAPSIVAEAMKYKGRVPYQYGGASPRGWDCSGFINYVLGHDLHITLPGGVKGFNGESHGPVVIQYVNWSGSQAVKGDLAPGDLVVFAGLGPLGHIGIVTGPDQMISALDPQYGTAVTPIKGFGPPGAPITYRRVKGTSAGGAVSSSAPGTSDSVAGDVIGAVLLGALGLAAVAAVVVVVGIVLTSAIGGLGAAAGSSSTRAASV